MRDNKHWLAQETTPDGPKRQERWTLMEGLSGRPCRAQRDRVCLGAVVGTLLKLGVLVLYLTSLCSVFPLFLPLIPYDGRHFLAWTCSTAKQEGDRLVLFDLKPLSARTFLQRLLFLPYFLLSRLSKFKRDREQSRARREDRERDRSKSTVLSLFCLFCLSKSSTKKTAQRPLTQARQWQNG